MTMKQYICDCPMIGKKLVNHTYACLVAHRGDRTLEDVYGRPSPQNERKLVGKVRSQLA